MHLPKLYDHCGASRTHTAVHHPLPALLPTRALVLRVVEALPEQPEERPEPEPRFTATLGGEVLETAHDGTLEEFVARTRSAWTLEDGEDVVIWDGPRVACLVRPGPQGNKVTWIARKARCRTPGGTMSFEENHPGAEYTPEEVEFLRAVDAYKRSRGRPFPSWTEVLGIARDLGYRKGDQP